MIAKATTKQIKMSNWEENVAKFLKEIEVEVKPLLTEFSKLPRSKNQVQTAVLNLSESIYHLKKRLASWKRQAKRLPPKEEVALSGFLNELSKMFAVADAAAHACLATNFKMRVTTLETIVEDIHLFYKKKRLQLKRKRRCARRRRRNADESGKRPRGLARKSC